MQKQFIFIAPLFFICCIIYLDGVAQQKSVGTMLQADSLFFMKNFTAAGKMYTSLLTDSSNDALHLNRLGYIELTQRKWMASEKHFFQALASNPSAGVKASVFSRLAMLASLQDHTGPAMVYLDSAIRNGYISFHELDSASAFNNLKTLPAFKTARDKLFNSIYPCYNDKKAREFDFWVGEWNVFVTGSVIYAGNSSIQIISGGCALLENWNSAASEGKSLNYIDDSTHAWKQVWVGSYPNGKQDFVHGEFRDSAMRFTFQSNDAQGNQIEGKFTFFNEGPDQVRQLNETSTDGGKTWTINYDFTYKRKK